MRGIAALVLLLALSSCAHAPQKRPRYRNSGDFLLRTEGPRRHLLAREGAMPMTMERASLRAHAAPRGDASDQHAPGGWQMTDYPSEDDLKRIEAWDVRDCAGLWDFLCSIWCWGDWGCSIQGGMWRLATGGWSGNEDIIGALQENKMFWLLCWQRSERGGLHWFKPWKEAAP